MVNFGGQLFLGLSRDAQLGLSQGSGWARHVQRGGAEGAWAPAPLTHEAQSALLSRQFFFFFFFFIKHPSVKALPNLTISKIND